MAAYFNGTGMSTGVESPIEKFLELRKWEFVFWNKDVSQNEVHPMNNFVVLDIGYTVKGKLWSDIEQKNTHSVYSNEIKHFWQKLHVTKTNFLTKEKNKVAEWVWKDIKESLPKYARLNIWVIVLDLNDMWVKEFFLDGKNYFKVSTFLSKEAKPWDILSIWTKVMYTNGIKDSAWNEVMVTEEFVNWLKGIEASKYENRYILDIVNTWKQFEDKQILEDAAKELDEYFVKKQEQYNKWETDKAEEATDNKMYQPTEEQLWVEEVTEIFDAPEKTNITVAKVTTTWDGQTIVDWQVVPF
jgi:hypothetical protein